MSHNLLIMQEINQDLQDLLDEINQHSERSLELAQEINDAFRDLAVDLDIRPQDFETDYNS